jgi:thymidylate synthase (FAD)
VPPAVEVLAHTADPERTVALAGRLCYSARGVLDLKAGLADEEVGSLVEKLLSLGHLSALEHAQFTLGIEGISRACSHQLVRHRIASYSQQSQRYVRMHEVRAVVPPSIAERPEAAAEVRVQLAGLWKLYARLVEQGIPPEDARYVLPNACETKVVVSMNARELRHFLALRLCRRAQWEIRDLAFEMLRRLRAVAPRLFADAGPGCLTGACPEGEYSCGRAAEVRKELAPGLRD